MFTVRDYIDEILRVGFTAKFVTSAGEIALGDTKVTDNGNEIDIDLKNGNAALAVKIVFTQNSAMALLNATTGDDSVCFVPENGLVINIVGLKKPDGLRLTMVPYSCCTHTQHCNDYSDMFVKTQGFFAKYGNRHYSAITLCGDNFKTWFSANTIRMSTDCTCISTMNGAFASISVADDPFVAIDTNYKDARKLGGLTVPLKHERTSTMDKFKGLGWCTWNAFEEDYNEEKIFAKLEELKSLGIPIGWVLLDDGWLVHDEDKKLLSLQMDSKKFPRGMKAFVDTVKSYGVQHVGLWHTIVGYWYGMVEGSQAHLEQKENLIQLENGMIVPSLDPEKGEKFWDDWYKYFSENGIDFVKIDSQTTYTHQLRNRDKSVRELMQTVYGYIEKAANKYLGGDIINCMGMDILNAQSRPHTLISRNSEDFWIENDPKGGLMYLLSQNVYNSVNHDKLYSCDYDMWWSNDITAVRCGVLRTVSGSISYLSDRKPGFDAEVIKATLDEDGTILLGDHAGYPTLDCMYGGNGSGILKVWNESAGSYGVAVYNCCNELGHDFLELENISGIDLNKEYVCYEYFSKSFVKMDKTTKVKCELESDDVLAYSLYPVECDEGGEYIMLGSTQMYTGYASKFKKKTYLCDIL